MRPLDLMEALGDIPEETVSELLTPSPRPKYRIKRHFTALIAAAACLVVTLGAVNGIWRRQQQIKVRPPREAQTTTTTLTTTTADVPDIVPTSTSETIVTGQVSSTTPPSTTNAPQTTAPQTVSPVEVKPPTVFLPTEAEPVTIPATTAAPITTTALPEPTEPEPTEHSGDDTVTTTDPTESPVEGEAESSGTETTATTPALTEDELYRILEGFEVIKFAEPEKDYYELNIRPTLESDDPTSFRKVRYALTPESGGMVTNRSFEQVNGAKVQVLYIDHPTFGKFTVYLYLRPNFSVTIPHERISPVTIPHTGAAFSYTSWRDGTGWYVWDDGSFILTSTSAGVFDLRLQ